MTNFQQVASQAIHGRPSAALRVRPAPPAIHGLRAGPLTFRADAWSVLAHQLQAVPCSETPPWRGIRAPGASWESKGYPYISIMEALRVQPSAARCRQLSQAQGPTARWPLDPCISRAYPMHMPCMEVHGKEDL